MWKSTYVQDTTIAETGTVSSTYTDDVSGRVLLTYSRRVNTLDIGDLRDFVDEAEVALFNAKVIDDGTQEVITRIDGALNDN